MNVLFDLAEYDLIVKSCQLQEIDGNRGQSELKWMEIGTDNRSE